MHTIQVYIDDQLDNKGIEDLRMSLLSLPFIENVHVNQKDAHDVLIEYEEDHILPMEIIKNMAGQGLHADIISG